MGDKRLYKSSENSMLCGVSGCLLYTSEIHMSQAARELSGKYDEVLVDEYQDSNLVQELLTAAVSGWINQKKNIFMVGDVKQSIYRFRLARPELDVYKRQLHVWCADMYMQMQEKVSPHRIWSLAARI